MRKLGFVAAAAFALMGSSAWRVSGELGKLNLFARILMDTQAGLHTLCCFG